MTVRPPITRRPVGRPSIKRRRGPDSPVRNGKVNKDGTYQTCGKCGKEGHNSRTCKGEVGANPPIKRPIPIGINTFKLIVDTANRYMS